MLKVVINKEYKSTIKEFIEKLPQIFNDSGEILVDSRNVLKVFDYKELRINVKSFAIPHIVNQIVYGNFRRSKAERSYRFAQLLDERGINTPTPLAYIEDKKHFLFKKSAYLSMHESFDGEMKVMYEGTLDQHKELIKYFAIFTAELHEKKILHLDYSSGNILYKLNDGKYHFYLVDLNRMKFDEEVTLSTACHNFRRLWGNDEMITYFVEEYAKVRGFDIRDTIGTTMKYRAQFWSKFRKKYPAATPYIG